MSFLVKPCTAYLFYTFHRSVTVSAETFGGSGNSYHDRKKNPSLTYNSTINPNILTMITIYVTTGARRTVLQSNFRSATLYGVQPDWSTSVPVSSCRNNNATSGIRRDTSPKSKNIQSNFNGSNTFGTMKICASQGWFEPMRVYYRAR